MKNIDQKPIIVTGLSGAGISSVLNALEDFGCEVFDNFPLAMIPSLCADQSAGYKGRIAIGVDSRTRGFSADAVLELVESLGARLVFITCEDAILQKRYTETRRRHPMARDTSLFHGIVSEKRKLKPLKLRADFVIDTTDTSIHDLRHILQGHFNVHPEDHLIVTLMSFGFRNGVPREADIVMDVRFLQNPHWDKSLKHKTGLDPDVGAYVRQDPHFESFVSGFKSLLQPLLPRYATEGKSYLTIAIGCTGGKHRSVYTVEMLKSWLEEQNVRVFVEHRDLPESP